MNIIWTSIVLFSLFFAISSNHLNDLITAIFTVPNQSLKLLLNIGSLIIIYNGIFQIALDSKLIRKISKIFSKFVRKVFCNIDEKTEELISANICANILGLGGATTPIALNIMEKINKNEKINNNILCLIGINVCSFTMFPLTPLTIRNSVNGNYGIIIWGIISLISFITTAIAIMIGKKWRLNK